MHVLSERQLRNGLAGLVTGGAIVAWCCTDLFGHELLASIAILALFAMSLDLLNWCVRNCSSFCYFGVANVVGSAVVDLIDRCVGIWRSLVCSKGNRRVFSYDNSCYRRDVLLIFLPDTILWRR